MYFADLELCHYYHGPYDANNWSVPLRAVGWLERPHAFREGTVPSAAVLKLEELAEQTSSAYLHHSFRGLHTCSLCPAGDRFSALPGSHVNLFVPGVAVVYVAPAGIIHYIEAHSYLPPAEFLEAVLRCPDCK